MNHTSLATLAMITGLSNANLASVAGGLALRPEGITAPHRLAHYYGQLLHENGAGVYDREIWGPTDAQKRYEGRKDLGNVMPGDGSRFRGRGPIQITGRANYAEFTRWCRITDPLAPDFTRDPDAVLTDPWEGLGPIWYWTTRDLNRLADANNIETLTRRINGGLNGYADRVKWYTRSALVLNGFDRDDVVGFQSAAGFRRADCDGIAGPVTRAALHRWLTLAGKTAAPAAPQGGSVAPSHKPAPTAGKTGEPLTGPVLTPPATYPSWFVWLIGR